MFDIRVVDIFNLSPIRLLAPRLNLNCVTESNKLSRPVPCDQARLRGRNLLGNPGPDSSPHWDCHVFHDCLSKQIKGVRALKDGGGGFYVLPQAAVAPIELGEQLMGLKHSACSQMEGTRSWTSKCSVIYIFSPSNWYFAVFWSYQRGIRAAAR